ncbi:hypothetical protein Nepgr_023155 [Nepenthes gracilis]|uniref:Uncharacterized protein n=1 Tax=Nepenthes gracilis TaxID=150966 RepID=A0AAD3XXM6_NEPGR|nr:hypothetical protein Nepgr_023155 [Nepenthes gracilis]
MKNGCLSCGNRVLEEVNWSFRQLFFLRWKITHGWAADMDEATVLQTVCISLLVGSLILSDSGVWPFADMVERRYILRRRLVVLIWTDFMSGRFCGV